MARGVIRPESALRDGNDKSFTTVKFLGREADAIAEVAIPPDADIHELLSEHHERVVLWGKARAKCQAVVRRLQDELDELRGLRFAQYWQAEENRERAEMKEHLHDEDETDKDPFHPGRRAKRAAYRAQKGYDAGRWRRNFTDDLINSYVSSDEKVVAAKKALRQAQSELDQVTAVTEALRHRQTALNHLAAVHRDTSRQ